MDDLQSKIGGNEEEEDRISTLPDEIIYHILSFVDSTDAVLTCVLSKRWVNLLSTLPFFSLGSPEFGTEYNSKFVYDFLVNRNPQSPISSIKINFWGFDESRIKWVLDYASTHHIQKLVITNAVIHYSLSFPFLRNLYLTSCHVNLVNWSLPSLETLHCEYGYESDDVPLNFPLLRNLYLFSWKATLSTWSLPSLTTLHLENVTISCGERPVIYMGFDNLKKLTLMRCPQFSDAKIFAINTPNLTSLTIAQSYLERTPTCEFIVWAPNLSCIEFQGEWVPTICAGYGFPLLNQVKLDIHIHFNKYGRKEYNSEEEEEEEEKQVVQKLTTLFHELQSTKFVAISFMTILALSRLSRFLIYQPSPFSNLESLTLLDSILEPEYLMNFPDHAISYLLNSSPCAKIFIKDCWGVTRNYDAEKNVLRWRICGYPIIESKVPNPSSTKIHVLDEVPCPETVKNKTNPPPNDQQSTSNIQVDGDGMHKVLEVIPNAVVNRTMNDKAFSYREENGFSLWEGHQIYSEYVDLLTLIKEKHPDTFEQFTPQSDIIYTVGLSTFCSAVQSFSEDCRSNSVNITRYIDLFSDLEKWGFNTTWLVNYLSNTDEVPFFCKPSPQ